MFFAGVKANAQSNVSDFTEFNDYWTGNATPPNISLTGDIIFGPALGAAASNLNMTIAGNDRIFDGVNTYSGLSLGSGRSLVINGGITLQNFSNSGNGGAIYAFGSNISFSTGNTNFQDNISGNGGAIYADSSNISFTNMYSEFTGNLAGVNGGGAIFARSVSNISFTGGSATFQGNMSSSSAVSGVGGGAIHLNGSTISFTNMNVNFNGNNAMMSGGAIYATGSSISFNSGTTIFQNNISTDASGGAIFSYGSLISFSGGSTTFQNNQAETGGAITLSYTSLMSFTNMYTEFIGNSTISNGIIALYNTSKISFSGGSATFQNNTGDAIYLTSGGMADFSGTLLSAQNNQGRFLSISVSGSATFFSSEVNISSNTSTATGGAISIFGNTSKISFSGGSAIFQNNTSLAGANGGGAIYLSASTISFTNTYTEFTGNNAIGSGGAIGTQGTSIINFNGGITIFQNNISSDGVAARGGGAIWATGGANISFSLGSTTFQNNISASGGGAIRLAGSTISFTNTYTEFTGNSSRGSGGAINVAGVINFSGGSVTFQNNISSGTGTNYGGGAIYLSGSTTSFTNMTVEFTSNNARSNGGVIYSSGSNISFSFGSTTFQNNISTGSGGAIYLTGSNISFSSGTTIFQNNISSVISGGGGAIYANSGSSISFSSGVTIFQNNISSGSASNGGAIYASGSNIKFNGGSTTFQNNVSTGSGGAIYALSGSTMSFANMKVEFTSNNAAGNGGAIFAQSGSNISFSLGSATFQNNISTSFGGAIYLNGSIMSFENMYTEFTGNNAGNHGGAIWANSSNISFNAGSATFQNNISNTTGGAIYLFGSTMSFTGMTVEFTSNNASNGGAIFLDGTGNIDFADSLIVAVGNTATDNGGFISSLGEKIVILTFSNITYSSNTAPTGGLLYGSLGTTFRFNGEYTDISNSTASSAGGAICLGTGGRADFSGTLLNAQNNRAANGGFLYVRGGTATFAGANITNNAANVYGGAIYSSGSTITIDSTLDQVMFAGNRATLGNDIYMINSIINFHAVNRITISSGIYVASNDNTINKTGSGELYLSGINYIQGLFSQSSGLTTINNSTTTFTNGILNVINSSGISILNSSVTFSPTVHMTFVSNSKSNGGAIHGDALSNVYFNGVSTFTYNKANNHGGALYIQQSTVTFTQAADFTLNQAITGHGGAIYMSSNNYVFNGATKFEINQALSGTGLGGAIYANNSTITFNAVSEFDTNQAAMGGAIYLKNNQTTFANNATFTGNKAVNGHGGAIYADADPVTINFAGTAIFENNQASLNGGALFLENSSVTFANSADFESNTATQNGGAMYIGFGTTVNAGNVTFNNNTAVNGLGGAVYMEGALGSNAVLNIEQTVDTVVSGNKAGLLSNTFWLEQYSQLNLDIAGDVKMGVMDSIVSLGNIGNVITKTGQGILELNNNNNAINGILNIYAGIVRTGYATGLGDIYFDNGTFNLTNTMTLSNNMYALTTSSIIDLDITDSSMTVVTLNGQIGNGIGTLEKNGLGRLIVNNMSNASIANTLINAGELEVLTNSFISPTLTVGADAALSGNGTIIGNVTNNGLISPGYGSGLADTQFGTLTINGNYTENGIFALRLHEGYMPINDKLQVNGTAVINDGSLIDLDLRQGFDIYLIYPVLQTTGGVEGIYSGLKTIYPSIDILISTDANNVYLKLAGVDTDYVNIPGGGHNNREVSRIIDNITSGGNPDEINNLSKIIGTMDPLDTAGRIRVLNEMAGSIYANALLMSGHQMRQAYHRILDRRESGYEGYNLWAGIYGSQKKMEEDSNSYDFKARNGYLILGLEKYSENTSFMMGYYGSIGQHDTHQWGDVVDINDYRGGLYAGSFKDKWTIRGELSGGYQQYQGKRQQLLLQSRTESEYDGWNINANVEAFYKILESNIVNISPFAGLDGSFIKTSGFREKGLDNAAAVLTVKDNQFEILNAVAGLRAEKEVGILRWYGEIGARYNLRGSKGTFTARLNNINEDMKIFGAGNNLLSGKAELGFSADIWKGLEVFAMGSYEKAERFWQVVGETGIGYRFGQSKVQSTKKDSAKNLKEEMKEANKKAKEEIEAFKEQEKSGGIEVVEVKDKPKAKVYRLNTVLFDFDKYELTPEGVKAVAGLARELRGIEHSRITVEGHTDDIGTLEYNEALSMRRANTVFEELARLGIDADRMEKKWHGKTRPIATNETDEGRAQNRRVEIVVE